MKLEQGSICTLDDGSEYVAISIVQYQGRDYVYFADQNDYKNYMIAECIEDEIEEVSDPDVLENLLLKFNENLKETLPKFIEENR